MNQIHVPLLSTVSDVRLSVRSGELLEERMESTS